MQDFHYFLARYARKRTFCVDVLQDQQEIQKYTSKIMESCLHDHCQNSGRTCKMLQKNYAQSRLTIVSREAKKSQRPLSELFTRNTTKKLADALAKPPRQLAPSFHSPNTFLLHRINKPKMVEIGVTVLKYWPLRV